METHELDRGGHVCKEHGGQSHTALHPSPFPNILKLFVQTQPYLKENTRLPTFTDSGFDVYISKLSQDA